MPYLGTLQRAAAIRFLTAAPGVVTRVEGVEPPPGVAEIFVPPVGRVVEPLRSSEDRVGSVIAVAADSASARQLAAATAARIAIATSPSSS
jgi:hypothetical protein